MCILPFRFFEINFSTFKGEVDEWLKSTVC